MDRPGPRFLCGKKALNRQISKVVYVQCAEIHYLHASLCPAGYGASGVARLLHGRLSMGGIATAVKNGSVKPSRSYDGDRSDIQLKRENVAPRVV